MGYTLSDVQPIVNLLEKNVFPTNSVISLLDGGDRLRLIFQCTLSPRNTIVFSLEISELQLSMTILTVSLEIFESDIFEFSNFVVNISNNFGRNVGLLTKVYQTINQTQRVN